MLPANSAASFALLPQIATNILRTAKKLFETKIHTDGDVSKRATIYDTGLPIGWLRLQEMSFGPEGRTSAIIQSANSYLVSANRTDSHSWRGKLPVDSVVEEVDVVGDKVRFRVTLVPKENDPPLLKELWKSRSPARLLETWMLLESGEIVEASSEQVGVGITREESSGYSEQWNWSPTDGEFNGAGFSDAVVKAGKSGAGVKVAILDTGISEHQAFERTNGAGIASQLPIVAQDLCTHDPSPTGKAHNGHGTQCASVLVGQQDGNQPFRGICPDIELFSGRVVDQAGLVREIDAYNGIKWALEQKVKIISMSWVLPGFSQLVKDIIGEASGTLFVAAPNNVDEDLGKLQKYPICYEFDHLIGVIASSKAGKLAESSDFDTSRKYAHVAAPGRSICVCTATGGFKTMSGTSIAAPQVAGLAALLFAQTPALMPKEVKDIIVKNVSDRNFPKEHCKSDGRINAAKALGV